MINLDNFKSPRNLVLDWAEQGHIPREQLVPALQRVQVFPDTAGWKRFIDAMLLWLGSALLSAGVIHFFAYNWQAMGRYSKFAMLELLIVLVLVLIWRIGIERLSGKSLLTGASLLVGGLLALIGQTYQTGADTYELFLSWAMLILPWVIIGRFATLWLSWLVLINIAVGLYYTTFGRLFGQYYDAMEMVWVFFWFNTVALIIWKSLAIRGVTWLQEQWVERILVSASCVMVSALALYTVMETDYASVFSLPVWLAWLAAAYFVYRRWLIDVYVLSNGVFSIIVVVTTYFGRHLVDSGEEAFIFLALAVLVIGMSAAGGWWLKQVAKEGGP